MRDGLVPELIRRPDEDRQRFRPCSRSRQTEHPRGAGREAAALEVGEGGVVGRDHSGAGTGLDAHVADGHAALHGEGADGGAGVLDDVAGGPGGADVADDVQDDVLAVTPGRACPRR